MEVSVCFVTGDQSLRGGTERACASVAGGLAATPGLDISILSMSGVNKSGFPLPEAVSLSTLYNHDRPRSLWRTLTSIILVPLWLIRNGVDTVVAVDSILFLYLLPLRLIWWKQTRIICWEHFHASVNLGVRRRDWARRLASRFADEVVVLTSQDKEIWVEKYPHSRHKLHLIPNMTPFFAETVEVNRKWCRRQTVLAVGRLVDQKGFDLLLEAWAEISVDIRRNWLLRIVGDGPQHDALEEKCRQLDLVGSVEFPGAVQDIGWEYRDASFFVLSSRFEGFGLVLLEALSHGLPCIAFDCLAGPRDIILHGVNGRLVPPGDIQMLASTLSTLLSDPEELDRMRDQTHRGLERFYPDAVLAQWRYMLELKGGSI